ncbi:uncharacterized protein LOC126847023 isoform X2 [Adelges cooleyi]|uniref:uncharacterized protein LOC126847023 isoform X2 n=1 Tax=Adelges cooleyi TaxID=133065 RepID=UPI0021801525|nr:uncharacterized protein LOC126847023 isoform X2 [Adelges cooleyi]
MVDPVVKQSHSKKYQYLRCFYTEGKNINFAPSYFCSFTLTNPTTQQDNRYLLKMTNIKLQVLCLFMLTIGISINNTKCVTQGYCHRQIFLTNHMISILNDDEKYELVTHLITKYEYDGIAEFIYPSGDEISSGLLANASMYSKMYYNERAIQRKLRQILVLRSQRSPHFTGLQSLPRFTGEVPYDSERAIRRNHLNSTFRYILNDRLNDRMCVENNIKCVLVGLIKFTLNYQLKNKAECNDNGTCIIIPLVWLRDSGNAVRDLPPVELFRDVYDTTQGYKTLFQSEQGELIPWESKTQEVPGAGPSNEE